MSELRALMREDDDTVNPTGSLEEQIAVLPADRLRCTDALMEQPAGDWMILGNDTLTNFSGFHLARDRWRLLQLRRVAKAKGNGVDPTYNLTLADLRELGVLSDLYETKLQAKHTAAIKEKKKANPAVSDQELEQAGITARNSWQKNIVNLSTVSTNLSTDVVGLVVVANKCGQCILSDCVCDTESKHNVHLGEVTIEFLLCHFIDTSHDVLVRLTDGLTDVLVVPWISRRSNRVPTLGLPLISLLTGCCSRFCAHLLCHVTHLGGYLEGATPLAFNRHTSPI